MGREDISEKCQHINFGMVLGMSTRKGTVKFLDDILRDVGEKMHEVMRTNQAKYEQVEDPEKTGRSIGNFRGHGAGHERQEDQQLYV